MLEKILTYYANWYDITRCPEEEAPMVASAAFHEHGTAYMISKKAEMWSADRHEYAYFFSLPELTAEEYERCFQKAYALGEPLVDPDKEGHMNTNLVFLFLADHVQEEAALQLKKCRVRKNFQFGLKGWMEVHVAAVDVSTETVYANGAGRNVKAYLERTLHPPKRRGGLLGKLTGR